MLWTDFIVRRSDVMFGKPTFIGTRISVEHVLERLGDGWSQRDILDQYPQLTAQHLQAAMAYAAAALTSDEFVVLGRTA